MKYLFFLIALISFGASSHCYISNGSEIYVSGDELKLDNMKGNVVNISNFKFTHKPICRNLFDMGADTVFNIKFPNETYYVYHADAGDIYLRATFSSDPALILYDKKDSFTEMDVGKINKTEITLTFDVVSKATGVSGNAKNINEGIQINFIPEKCIFSGCWSGRDNTNHYYRVTYIPQIKQMTKTCRFNDGVLTAPAITISDLNNNTSRYLKLEPTSGNVSFICNKGLSSYSFKYHFESENIQGNILKNEHENKYGGAGDVGFEISLNGSQAISFSAGNSSSYDLLNFKDITPEEQRVDLNLYGRYVAYGQNIRPGKVQSRVKVVTEYE
ncbi:hypothetical protein HV198_08280 [Citrobacter freundii]|uniref:fimbrial protein n=1 Tax=Citrobacter TaxID=544 RepID=UPI000E3E4944|nr:MULTISPECIES: hypothetical protein [Citrobacter]MBD0827388.1 hypothetical protein [Citrobacter sp. C1]QLO42148.1 hypothetical protein HV215_08280 [Citrobacter freundii]QLV40312.1 hypothetical protein HV198_08280 [Citrobacter freundii]RFU90017.1 hypothetical protein DZA29_19840 [Citrobacter gillenii]WFW61853.1 hypothetical protein NFJ76_07790 [Citrobacter freundii]